MAMTQETAHEFVEMMPPMARRIVNALAHPGYGHPAPKPLWFNPLLRRVGRGARGKHTAVLFGLGEWEGISQEFADGLEFLLVRGIVIFDEGFRLSALSEWEATPHEDESA